MSYFIINKKYASVKVSPGVYTCLSDSGVSQGKVSSQTTKKKSRSTTTPVYGSFTGILTEDDYFILDEVDNIISVE